MVDSHFWDSSQSPSLSLPFLNFVLFLSCLHSLNTAECLLLSHPLPFSQSTMAKFSPTFQVEPTNVTLDFTFSASSGISQHLPLCLGTRSDHSSKEIIGGLSY